MKIEINPKGFDDINTAVLYRFHGFVPEEKDWGTVESNIEGSIWDKFKADKVMYKGSIKSMSLASFAEYKFDFKVEKNGVDDILLPNFFDKSSRDIFMRDFGMERFMSDLESFVPSSVSENTGYDNYFGSFPIDTNTVYLLEALGVSQEMFDGIWKIEFYETEALVGNSRIGGDEEFYVAEAIINSGQSSTFDLVEPAIVITLGPSPLDNKNSENLYLEGDSRKINQTITNTGIEEWCKLMEEITCDKAVILTTALISDEVTVNLAYKSWSESKNPHRNLNHWFLRNDEFDRTKSSLSVINVSEKDENIWLDQRSGTLVGNVLQGDPIVMTPILWKKLQKVKQNKDVFSPYHCYNLGDIVTYGENKWECISDYTMGESPALSKSWILADQVEDIFTSRVLIGVENEKGGTLNPGTSVTIIDPDNTTISFKVIEDLGYKLNSERPCYADPSISFPRSGFKINSSVTPKTIDISEWKDAIESGILTFCFDFIGSSIVVGLRFEDKEWRYCSDWEKYFTEEPELNISSNPRSMYVVSSEDRYYFYSSRISGSNNTRDWECRCDGIPVEENIILHFPELRGYEPTLLTQLNTLEGEITQEEVFPKQNSDGSWNFEGRTDFSEGMWWIDLKVRDMKITGISKDNTFILSDNSKLQLIPYRTNGFLFEFYNEVESEGPKDWKVSISSRSGSQVIELGTEWEGWSYDLWNGLSFLVKYDSFKRFYILEFVGLVEEDLQIELIKK